MLSYLNTAKSTELKIIYKLVLQNKLFAFREDCIAVLQYFEDNIT